VATETRRTTRLASGMVQALVNESLRDTEPDDMPLVIEARLPDLSRLDEPWDITVTEPIPAPIFAEAMRRLERVVLLGAVIVGGCIALAAWMGG
jgi:hypothetical protein